MRILFTTAPFRSHLYVQVTLAWALRAAGHEVRIAGTPMLAEDIAHVGLTGISVGDPIRLNEVMAGAEPPEPPSDPHRGKAVQSDYALADPCGELASNVQGWRALFNPDSAFDDLVRFAKRWKPDLVISDTFMFIGAVAARVTGAAYARILFGADGLAQIRAACHRSGGGDPLADWLRPILERHGCAFDEEIALGQWTIFPMPPSVWRPEGVHYVPMRHIPFNGPCTTPDWLLEPPTRRRVCVTLGLAHREDDHGITATARDLFEAVAGLDVEVIATLNAKQLGSAPPPPANVRVVEFAPLNLLLPTCAAVVHSGGAGTFATAVEHGVPQLIVPNVYWSEKWWGSVAMANAVERRGAGVYVADADQLTADKLREGLVQVLKDPSFAENAAKLRTESLGMPSPHELVPVLEKLTAEHLSTGEMPR